MTSSSVAAFNGLTVKAPGIVDVAAVEKENCLKEIANNYVEEEDVDNSSSEERGDTRENGLEHSEQLGHGGRGERTLGGNRAEDDVENARDSDDEVDRIEVSSQSSGEERSGETSEEEEEEEEEVGYMGSSLSRDTEMAENGFVNNASREEGSMDQDEQGGSGIPANQEDPSEEMEGMTAAAEKEKVESAHECTDANEAELQNDVEEPEKSLSESQDGPQFENGGVLPGPTLRRRRGCLLKSNGRKPSMRAAPITPKLEEPRAVRSNRGIKRRFPGDESEDSLPKRIRVRSIASVCGDFAQPIKGEDLSMEESLKMTPERRRGRPRKADALQVAMKEDEDEVHNKGKGRMVESLLESDSVKRPCHGRNGPIFACNAEGCKKRFVEPAALYTHARVHGDRPYVCHYDGCIKSFSERSKLKRHFLIHTGEKPFLCIYEGCGKAFSLDFNLRSHMKTHTGDYHECPYDGCEKRYCQEYKLRAHIGKEHSKPVRGTKKLATVGGNHVRGANGSNTQDAAATKKREMVAALRTKRSKLEASKEETVRRISELDQEKQKEASELARIEQDLRKLERELRQLEEGQVGSPAISLSLSEEEDADDEGEEMAPSNGTAGDTNTSGEQQSRLLNSPLEYTAMGEGRDVLMFAHKLPTADQGARLMKNVEARPADTQQEPTTSLTPMLWLQGAPPHQGRLAEHTSLRPFLRSRRPVPTGPDTGKPAKASGAHSSLGMKEKYEHQKRVNAELWSQGESSDSGLGKSNGEVGKVAAGKLDGGLGKPRGSTVKTNLVMAGRVTGKANVRYTTKEKPVRSTEGENGKVDHRPQKRDREQTKAPKQLSGRQFTSSDQVFVSMNPILLSTDHGFSPTDARFLAANEGFSSLAQQGSLRDRLQLKEGVKTAFAGQTFGPKEKVFRSMNEVLHSTDQGFVASLGPNERFVAEQAPSEQSFEPSAAQLFTYHEQPRLVD